MPTRLVLVASQDLSRRRGQGTCLVPRQAALRRPVFRPALLCPLSTLLRDLADLALHRAHALPPAPHTTSTPPPPVTYTRPPAHPPTRRRPYATGDKELIVVTLLVAADGGFKLPQVTSRREMQEALSILGAVRWVRAVRGRAGRRGGGVCRG